MKNNSSIIGFDVLPMASTERREGVKIAAFAVLRMDLRKNILF